MNERKWAVLMLGHCEARRSQSHDQEDRNRKWAASPVRQERAFRSWHNTSLAPLPPTMLNVLTLAWFRMRAEAVTCPQTERHDAGMAGDGL